MPEPHVVDRLWPVPALGLALDEATDGFSLEPMPADRPLVAINMITSLDGRAQLQGTAEGLGSRADRRLMRLYRSHFDAVGTGAGTLRASGVPLRVSGDLEDRRLAEGRPGQPTGVVVAGEGPIPTDARWFAHDEPRILFVGAGSPVRDAPGTEVVRAPTRYPEPGWVLDRLSERGLHSLLLEGGPHLNAAFLAAGLLDEVYLSIGAHLLGTDALPMIAPVTGGSPYAAEPRHGRLVSVLRHDEELFLRYRFPARG